MAAAATDDAIVGGPVDVLPADLTYTLAGEGSANAVFRMHTAPTASASTASTPLLSYLLRVPKAAAGVSPHVCLDHHTYYVSVLLPLLGADLLVRQRLVRGVTSLQPQLNRLLAARDQDPLHRRRPDWKGTRLAAGVDVALLVEDMNGPATSPRPSLSASPSACPAPVVTIQFKPKWLAQSPTAPPGARRCRTCALSASLASQGPAQSGRRAKPCPLVLVADQAVTKGSQSAQNTQSFSRNQTSNVLDNALWEYVCHHLEPADLPSASASASASAPASASQLLQSPPVRAAIVHWLRTTDLFRRVAAIQQEYDPAGALHVRSAADSTRLDSLDRLQTAMTLRDCTCYLRVALDPDGRLRDIGAKLGDLDRKNGQQKLERWQAQERALIDGGFYTATEARRQTTLCWLER